ncbi:NADPH-dependent FMN reductase [Sphingomonas echinoides]|uniref:NADPH-dependent FMN reductase n=1 Tax=Sphingomonas echinoides TaxID=59803 RepID=UPI0024138E84|nr:NADPH-dependent FMN reductase [Sphingomonas echinoides]
MTKLPRIGVILGSLQTHGITRKIAHAMQDLVGDRLALEIIEIGDLPLYNPERDGEGIPAWATFRQTVAPVDGILFLTPEYNRSIPAALKNAIDVGSRPHGDSVWAQKPAGIISQSPGMIGGFGANHHLRQCLVFLDMPAMQQPETYLSRSAALFDDAGRLIEGPGKVILETFADAFAKWVVQYRFQRTTPV